jgi:hypothetical protein
MSRERQHKVFMSPTHSKHGIPLSPGPAGKYSTPLKAYGLAEQGTMCTGPGFGLECRDYQPGYIRLAHGQVCSRLIPERRVLLLIFLSIFYLLIYYYSSRHRSYMTRSVFANALRWQPAPFEKGDGTKVAVWHRLAIQTAKQGAPATPWFMRREIRVAT